MHNTVRLNNEALIDVTRFYIFHFLSVLRDLEIAKHVETTKVNL